MRYTSIGLCLAVLALSGVSARADDTATAPPVDRAASLARAPQFAGKVEAALGQPVATLYQAAMNGGAGDNWTYALAMVAKRDNMDAVPPVQRQLYIDYAGRVDEARSKYQKKHKHADTSAMTMDQFVQPTEAEQQAVLLVHTIHDPDYWFGRFDATGAKVDAAAIQQSRQCVDALHKDVAGEDMMTQLMGALQMPITGKDGEKENGTVDMGSLMASLDDGEPSDQDLDNQALCGGKDLYANDKVLMKAIYKSDITISVKKDKS